MKILKLTQKSAQVAQHWRRSSARVSSKWQLGRETIGTGIPCWYFFEWGQNTIKIYQIYGLNKQSSRNKHELSNNTGEASPSKKVYFFKSKKWLLKDDQD